MTQTAQPPPTIPPPEAPKPQAVVPVIDDSKVITLTKTPSGWRMQLRGKIRMRDINHLVRYIRVEYNRAKRTERLKLKTAARQKEARP